MFQEGIVEEAASLMAWIETIRSELGHVRLPRVLQKPWAKITLVNHEIWLDETPNGPRDHLKTRLDISLDPERYVDHHEWYNGFRVRGGGVIRTADGLYHSSHPKMIHAIYGLAAEGQLWDRLVTGFKELIERAKDM